MNGRDYIASQSSSSRNPTIPIVGYQLETCFVLRKYIGVLDVFLSRLFMLFTSTRQQNTTLPMNRGNEEDVHAIDSLSSTTVGPYTLRRRRQNVPSEIPDNDETMKDVSYTQEDDMIHSPVSPKPIYFFASPGQYLDGCWAMFQHRTQLVWFRYLYILFSRYMIVNKLEKME
jgi:hypothetical protein